MSRDPHAARRPSAGHASIAGASPAARHRPRLAPCLALALLLALAAPIDATAAEQSAARKLGRGLAAMTTGFLEVPGNIVQTSRQRGWGWGFTLGFAKGLGGIVVRELVGVYEFVTAPFPVPEGFQPIIEPEFPWGYFDER